MTAMFDVGIVPLVHADLDVNKLMADFPPDEQRKMKRKFRKLWRQVYKNELRKKAGEQQFFKETLDQSWGVGSSQPSIYASRKRKRRVKSVLQALHVWPLYKKMTDCSANVFRPMIDS